jgi:methyl-accepting chemotaxis protein-1 (serine sensor receptor)
MLKNTSIKSRLIFVLTILGVELLIGAGIGLYSLGRANDQFESLYADSVICIGQLDQLVRTLDSTQLAVFSAVNASSTDGNDLLKAIDENAKEVDYQWQMYTSTKMSAAEREVAGRFTQARQKFVAQALQPAIAALRGGDQQRAEGIFKDKGKTLFTPMRASIDELILLQMQEAKNAELESKSRFALVRWICIIGMSFGFAIAGIVGVAIVRSIVEPLNKAMYIAALVANGDLTQKINVTSTDETGRLMSALREMTDGLAAIVGRVRTGTDAIASASGQIAAGSRDLAARTEQQAASLQETSATMEELTAAVKENAENARQANVLAQSAAEVASQGGVVMTEVVATLGDINRFKRIYWL